MNVNKKILVFVLVIIIIVSLILLYINTRLDEKVYDNQVYLLQTSAMNAKNTVNKFQYYDVNGNLIKEESFKDKGDISYNCHNSNYIYSFGPGGLYETNSETMKTEKISDEDINIVKFYNNQMYYFINKGFTKDAYSSKICTKDKCIEVDFFIVDFVIYDGKYYILGLDSLYIYDDNEQLKKINTSDFNVYQKILEIDNRIFLVNEASFYEIKNDEIILFSNNGIIKDLNFKTYKNLDNIQFIFDADLKKILKIELIEDFISLTNNLDINKNLNVSYDFNLDKVIGYNVDYKTNRVIISELDNNVISEFSINISKNESVFKVYKLK